MLNIDTYRYLKTFLLIVLSSIIGLFSVLVGYINEGVFGKGIIIILLSCINGSILLLYMRQRLKKTADIMDFGFIFSGFFIVYNVFLLLNVGVSFSQQGLVKTQYPISFEADIYIKASLLVFLACSGLLVGETIFKQSNEKRYEIEKILFNSGNNVYYVSGVLLFVIGIILLFFDYNRIGGFFYALKLDRGVRMDLLSQSRGNLPYSSFIFTGLALIAFSLRRLSIKSFKSIILMVLLAAWCTLLIIQGDRRFLLYSFLIFFTIYFYGKKINIKRVLFSLILLYVLFSVFQQVRYMIPLILNSEASISDLVNKVRKDFNIEWLLPVSNEAAGPYFTLLWHLKFGFSTLYGYSYVMSIPNILPRSLYPGEKPLTIAQDFANYIHDVYYPFRSSIIGWGFSPIAEAYVNFGVAGVFIVFLLLSLLFRKISEIKHRANGYWIMIVGSLMPQAFNLNRINFSSVVQESVINLFILFFSVFFIHIVLNNRFYKKKRRIT
ncbi:O-antigen polymerase [Geobacillus sp. C56-T3]|uniref:O-antigen polymerase n=1 Tax=Geobacillus sp. (strain C56-T3) TaxID=691437 RepID=UPI0001D58A0F|nr:O-antigen polymerase [Geobacillus sp. C56-T3]ADI28216.1 hypothetical protein GC56T3_3302 [Geobacillus sp. C56-T3]